MFPQIFGKYVLERELASGGMARVFLATLRGAGGFEKRLVVKQIRPELASDQSFIRRFVAEAKTTVDLSHANIVPVYELGAEQGTYYIAMELCAGVSLAELLRAGACGPSEVAYIGVEICRALDYAHRKAEVVHRDVTPRNVMIDAEGGVRLIDFGIAASSSADAALGPCFGSPGHMPPEQLRGGVLTPAADVYAVAVLLIEAWTGRPPFRRESFELSERARREPREPLADTDASLAALDPLITAALADAPGARPQTAEELARPLREYLRQHDLGDIARRLGQRVNELSERRSLERAAADGAEVDRAGVDTSALGSSTGTGSSAALRADVGSGATLTFAARDALLEWTAKIESHAPPPRASSTLASSSESESGMVDPLALASASEVESGLTAPSSLPARLDHTRRARGERAAVLALGLAGVVLLASGIGQHGWLRDAPPATPGRAAAPSALLAAVARAPATDAHRASGAPGVPALHEPATNQPTTPASNTLPATATGTAARDTTAMDRAERSVAFATVRTPVAVAPSPAQPGARLAITASSTAAKAPTARLQLTAEPAAWVEIDGTRVGRTPLVNLGVTPGRHSIAFVSQLLGERLETSVGVDPKTSARIHADFTSASPQVYVR